jgi:hypothetical protein
VHEKAEGQLTPAFTPAGGPPSTETQTTKLKLKRD